MKLDNFLASKPLFYAKIDYTRMPKAYESIKEKLKIPNVVHVVGTNGKGTTGRFLSLMLKQAGLKVGHYTSPHIFEFRERIWIDGKCIDNDTLEALHVKLLSLLSNEFLKELSYFEYTTFLALLCFQECDVVVLEAGLGGEYDATNVFEKNLSIITPIGLDHAAFLGEDIESVATTKLNSITNTTILASNQDAKVVEIAEEITKKKQVSLLHVKESIDTKTKENIVNYCKKHEYPSFFIDNLSTAYVAAKSLHVKVDFENLQRLDLAGRCQKIGENITIDCGHNPLAANALKKQFDEKSQILIFNSFEDKDYKKTLEILKPIVKNVEILRIDNDDRIVDEKDIIKTLNDFEIEWSLFNGNIKEDESYLVFGSFKVVENFLERINEK